MSKLRRVSGKATITALERLGFFQVWQRVSYVVLWNKGAREGVAARLPGSQDFVRPIGLRPAELAFKDLADMIIRDAAFHAQPHPRGMARWSALRTSDAEHNRRLDKSSIRDRLSPTPLKSIRELAYSGQSQFQEVVA